MFAMNVHEGVDSTKIMWFLAYNIIMQEPQLNEIL